MTLLPRTHAIAAIAAGGLALALAGCSATTYGTGRPQGLQTITDLVRAPSLKGEARTPIEYAQRPPVVEPPSTASLPSPGSDTVALAANWPNDPDQQAEATKIKIAEAQANGDPLNLPKLPVRTRADGPTRNQLGITPEDEALTTREQAAEVRARMAAAKGVVKYDQFGNPVRQYLSDPPSEYLEPDPEAPPPTEVAAADKKSKVKWPWQWFSRSN